MAVDFDKLVLAPAMAVFAEPVTVTPEGGAPVAARGSYSERPIEEFNGDTSVVTSQHTLSIRDAEFPVAPVQGLAITVRGVLYTVDKPLPDGQGGTLLILKKDVP